MGYHKREIKKYSYGTIRKIVEEVEEYEDSIDQGNKIMAMLELSDIYGALEVIVEQHGLSMDEVKLMSDATKSAFADGSRVGSGMSYWNISKPVNGDGVDKEIKTTIGKYMILKEDEIKTNQFKLALLKAIHNKGKEFNLSGFHIFKVKGVNDYQYIATSATLSGAEELLRIRKSEEGYLSCEEIGGIKYYYFKISTSKKDKELIGKYYFERVGSLYNVVQYGSGMNMEDMLVGTTTNEEDAINIVIGRYSYEKGILQYLDRYDVRYYWVVVDERNDKYDHE